MLLEQLEAADVNCLDLRDVVYTAGLDHHSLFFKATPHKTGAKEAK